MITVSKTLVAKVGLISELSRLQRNLVLEAKTARENAQAPYSNFMVGAAIKVHGVSEIITGCNVEACSYTQTTHAEQCAICASVAQYGPRRLEAIAIAAGPRGEKINFADIMPKKAISPPIDFELASYLSPCGHCLQIIWEQCGGNPDIPVISPVPHGLIMIASIGTLFPCRFGPEALGIKVFKLD